MPSPHGVLAFLMTPSGRRATSFQSERLGPFGEQGGLGLRGCRLERFDVKLGSR